MIAKDKAEQLTNKFLLSTPITCDIEDAKRCALITVDEILELTKRNTYNPFDWNEITGVRYDKFWQQVKQEIQKL
jgi:malonyl CoA-acyl carrier protein transacylase